MCSEITDHGKKLQVIQSEFLQLIDEMAQETDAIWHQIEQNVSQVWRRAYCKSLFSFVEGVSYLLKREIIILREGEGWAPEGKDEWVLTESRPGKMEDGKETKRPFFLPPLDNLTYALEEFAYWNWADYQIDKKCEGWSNLCKASTIRNRITQSLPRISTCLTQKPWSFTLLQKISRIWWQRLSMMLLLLYSVWEGLSSKAAKRNTGSP